MKSYLLIRHLRIHNANALSSPYTIGFPAMTAWLGGVHALERAIQAQGMKEVFLTKTAISCHELLLQTFRGKGDYVNSIIGTANPLKKDGERPSFIEEARCHLDVSLLIEVSGVNGDNQAGFLAHVRDQLYRMKMAGGDILSFQEIAQCFVDDNDAQQEKKLVRKLMPGYVLVERRDLMTAAMLDGKDALEALLEHLQVMHYVNVDEKGNENWTATKKVPGWIVPVAVGFHGVSDIGKAKNQRDENTPHCFAESVITLGEFKMPYRIQWLDEIMWQYSAEPKQGQYVCKNQ